MKLAKILLLLLWLNPAPLAAENPLLNVDFMKQATPAQIQTALADGADPNAKDRNGLTPLMDAINFGNNLEIVMTLLKGGADPKAKDKQGQTAFDWLKEKWGWDEGKPRFEKLKDLLETQCFAE